jgi:ABC-2 type transport system ATP-binding protein
MLELSNISKEYKKTGTRALSSISINAGKGERIALLGANGAGKTTLINIIAGIIRADSGKASLDGEDLFVHSPRVKSKTGIVHQEVIFDFVFTVREMLMLTEGYYGLKHDEAYMNYLLERLSLTEKKDVKSRSLSGGMKRRLMIARALIHKPEYLFLDEPTAGVDISQREEMYSFIKELNEQDMTYFLTTHYLDEAERLCDRIIVIRDGKIFSDSSAEEFKGLDGDKVKVRLTFSASGYRDDFIKAVQLAGIEDLSIDTANLRIMLEPKQLDLFFRKLADHSHALTSFAADQPTIEDVFRKVLEGSYAAV